MDMNEEKKEEATFDNLATGSTNEARNLRLFLIGLIGAIIAIVATLAVIGIYRVYAKTATDKFTVVVADILRLPALKVDGERVLYASYVEDLKAISTLRGYDKANGGQYAKMTDQEMSDQVLWRLMNNVLVEKAAKTFAITVAAGDIDSLKSQVLQQFKDTATAEAELKKRYGWNMDEYTKKVMRPYVLQNKINSKIQADKTMADEVKKQAEKVLRDIKSGVSFASSAAKYGQDGTAAKGGDLGWFKKGDMVLEFENAVFALKKGELGKSLVETSYGYHIIKLIDKKKEKEKDKDGKETEVEKVRASHILFRYPDVSWYLSKSAGQARIHLYLKVNNPFKEILTKKA